MPHPVDVLQEVVLVPGEPVVVLLAAALVLVGQGVQGGHVDLGHLGGRHALGQVELEAGQGVSQVPGDQEGGGRRTVGLHHGHAVGLVEDDADLLLVALDTGEHLAQGSEDCSAGRDITWVISRETPILFTSKNMTMSAARLANQPMAPG